MIIFFITQHILSILCFSFLLNNILNCLKRAKINPISSLEIIEWEQFGLRIKYLVLLDIVPELIIHFVLKIEFDLKFWVSSLGLRVVSKKLHEIGLVELCLGFIYRIESIDIFL